MLLKLLDVFIGVCAVAELSVAGTNSSPLVLEGSSAVLPSPAITHVLYCLEAAASKVAYYIFWTRKHAQILDKNIKGLA
jgi:hypothetical protein